MKGILRRPLALSCAVFLGTLFGFVRTNTMGGSLPALLMGAIALILSAIALVSGLLSSYFIPRLRSPFLYSSALILAVAMAFFTAWRIDPAHQSRILHPFNGEVVDAFVTVERTDTSGEYSTVLIGSLLQGNGNPTDLRGRITLPYAADLQPGNTIVLSLQLRLLETDGTLKDCYDLSQGLCFEATATDEGYTLLSVDEDPTASQKDRFRRFIRRSLSPYLSPEEIGLASALLLGDKSNLPLEWKSQLSNLGLSHTLAVSGLHLGILFGSLIWLLRKLKLPRLLHFPLLFPILFGYCALVGSPSVLRAGGMLIFLFAAHPLGRMRDSITSLFATVSMLCILSPYSILDIGLLLSFFATWGILLIPPVFTEKISPLPALPRAVLTALTVGLSATLFTMPFSVWYFGEWAILSPLANLLIVPILTLLLYLLPLLCLLSSFPILAYTPAVLTRRIISIVTDLAGLWGSDDRLLLPLSYPILKIAALLLIIAVILLCLFRKTRPLTLAVLVIFLSFSGVHNWLYAQTLLNQSTVSAISDGKNDCLLIRSGTQVLLIDRSEGGYDFLSNALSQGETDRLIRVDTILLTHYHYRQISSLTRILKDSHVEHLLLPKPTTQDEDISRILTERAEAWGCSVEFYSAELSAIGYHDFEITVDYYPDDAFRSITVTCGTENLIYAEDTLFPAGARLLPAHYRNHPETIDPAWNQVYDFSENGD